MAASNSFSGARAIFRLNGIKIAFASGVSGEENIEYEPVDVLDLLEVREFVPVSYKATLNATVFRVIGSSLKAMGIFPKEQNILTSGDMTATIHDDPKATGLAAYTYENVRATSASFDITARGVVSENVGFVAIRRFDEFERP